MRTRLRLGNSRVMDSRNTKKQNDLQDKTVRNIQFLVKFVTSVEKIRRHASPTGPKTKSGRKNFQLGSRDKRVDMGIFRLWRNGNSDKVRSVTEENIFPRFQSRNKRRESGKRRRKSSGKFTLLKP